MRRARYAYVALAALTLTVAVVSILFTVTYYHTEQAAQQRQGEQFEAKLCATLGSLAALQPPPGSAAGNPSRAYLQQEHAVLAELGPDVGCDRRTP